MPVRVAVRHLRAEHLSEVLIPIFPQDLHRTWVAQIEALEYVTVRAVAEKAVSPGLLTQLYRDEDSGRD